MSLSSSDWLQVVLFLAAVMIGVITSWIFFRAQQKTDFNRLRESITRLESMLSLLEQRINSSTDVKEAINDLYNVKASIDTINTHLSYSVRHILSESRKQYIQYIQDMNTMYHGRTERELQDIVNTIHETLSHLKIDRQQFDQIILKLNESHTNIMNEIKFEYYKENYSRTLEFISYLDGFSKRVATEFDKHQKSLLENIQETINSRIEDLAKLDNPEKLDTRIDSRQNKASTVSNITDKLPE